MRSARGMSLIEMLTTIFIISFVGVGMAELAVTQNVVAFRTQNKISQLISARNMSLLLQRDLHSAYVITSGTPQTLMLQVPIFNGDAMGLPTNTVSQIAYLVDNDLDHPGQFLLRRNVDGTSQVALKSIIGPFASNNSLQPSIFTFFDRPDLTEKPFTSGGTNSVGVGLSLELRSNEASARQDVIPQAISFRQEYFMRSNCASAPY